MKQPYGGLSTKMVPPMSIGVTNIPPLEHFWEEHPWISWATSLSLPFGRQKSNRLIANLGVRTFCFCLLSAMFPDRSHLFEVA